MRNNGQVKAPNAAETHIGPTIDRRGMHLSDSFSPHCLFVTSRMHARELFLEIVMNKAFTKETDDADDDEAQLPLMPSGGKNYITPQGYARIRAKLLDLIDSERPKVVEIVYWAASNGDRSENGDYIYGKKRLREIDRRIRFLTKRLQIMEIADPAVHHGSDQIFFGSTVTYLDATGVERTVTILGIDEADSSQAQVSWVSPIARTLLKARTGDVLPLATPAGMVEIEVTSVQYPAPGVN
jgi:transcription elongation factor GreB